MKDVKEGFCGVLSLLLLEKLTHVKQPGLFKVMSFPAWQERLGVLYLPLSGTSVQKPSEWQQRDQQNPGHRVGSTAPNQHSWDLQRLLWVPGITNRRNNSANKGARMSWNAKYLNVLSSHAGWLCLAVVDPRICLAVPWALPMEKHCWGAGRQHRWGTGPLPWRGAGPAQLTHRIPS